MTFRKNSGRRVQATLDMTPMIDVVFQLLIFFVVTLKQDDIFSKLTAARPAPNDKKEDIQKDPPLTVTIAPQGFIFNDRPMTLTELDRNIERISGYSKTAMVVIKCTADSPHAFLINVLDICYKYGMTSLSIFSM